MNILVGGLTPGFTNEQRINGWHAAKGGVGNQSPRYPHLKTHMRISLDGTQALLEIDDAYSIDKSDIVNVVASALSVQYNAVDAVLYYSVLTPFSQVVTLAGNWDASY